MEIRKCQYHAELINQSDIKNKWKIANTLIGRSDKKSDYLSTALKYEKHCENGEVIEGKPTIRKKFETIWIFFCRYCPNVANDIDSSKDNFRTYLEKMKRPKYKFAF